MPASRAAAALGGVCLALATGASAQAGAWPRERGESLLIVTGSWHRLAAPQDGAVLFKREAAIYGEYGATGRITLVGRFALQDFREEIRTDDTALAVTYATFGGSEAGARVHLARLGRWCASGQLLVTLPSAGENRTNAEHGTGGGDVDLRALVGRSIGEAGFAEIQLGLREREGEGGSEVRFDTAFGWELNSRLRLHLQTYSVWSHELDTTRLRDFSGHRAQVSVLASLGGGRYAQLGVMSTVRAHDMADEAAAIIGVWQQF
ncbi:hypothetical protein E5163_00330 [Marinicauda algicola]|uniref:Transporter n=1 Tax=Marinicauda algicola TaxID=2029849 RepID=A0A4V6RF55_9PROT|nr:hypothetical protein [Marinicauda algicola]TGY89629.1 hypothetical protein E5163_00330 [Marinicauda algicola]